MGTFRQHTEMETIRRKFTQIMFPQRYCKMKVKLLIFSAAGGHAQLQIMQESSALRCLTWLNVLLLKPFTHPAGGA